MLISVPTLTSPTTCGQTANVPNEYPAFAGALKVAVAVAVPPAGTLSVAGDIDTVQFGERPEFTGS